MQLTIENLVPKATGIQQLPNLTLTESQNLETLECSHSLVYV